MRRRMQNQTIILTQAFQSASPCQVDFSLCLGEMRTSCEKHLGEKEAEAHWSDSQAIRNTDCCLQKDSGAQEA